MDDWKESLPETLRDAPYFKNAESADQVLADLNNASQWQGNSIRIPGPDAGAEDIAAFQQKAIEKLPGLMPVPNLEDQEAVQEIFNRLGKPESPDAYGVPEGVEMDVAQLRAYAHENNLTNAQFQGLVAKMAHDQSVAADTYKQELESQYETLKSEWGAAYEQNYNEVGKLLADAPASIQEAWKNQTLPTDQMRWLLEKSQLGEENAQAPGHDDGRPTIPTPQEAEEQLAEVERRLFALQPSDPEYAVLTQKRMKLIGYVAGLPELPPMRVVDG